MIKDSACLIDREEGVIKGLWRGIGPNIARNAIVNAVELASYDQVSCVCMAMLSLLPSTA